MTAKLRIKAKGIEIEWEGEVEFLKTEVPDLIGSIIQAIGVHLEEQSNDNEDPKASAHSSTMTFTTAAAAAKLQVKTGPELFKVALAKLQVSDGIEPASRDQILDEMKNAPRVFNENMRKNMTHTIAGLLTRGEINEPTSGSYALSHGAYESFVGKFKS